LLDTAPPTREDAGFHDELENATVTARGRRPMPLAYRIVVAIVRPLLMVLTKRDWRGAEHIPQEGGFVVTPNHISYVEPLTFAHFMHDNGREPYYLAKEGVFRIPLVGAVIRGAQQIPVYRESGQAADAFRAAVTAITEQGKCIGVYPEGTLTRDPDLWPMQGKTGAARIALATRCPVIPVAQWGPQEILAPYSTRLRLFPRKTMHVLAGPPVPLDDLYDQPLTATVLREATDRIMAAITAQLEVLRGEPAPAERFDGRRQGLPSTGNPKRRRRR
jgi:1-acyl-sn-glycerol-3-phosphate acyltransferase